MSPITRTAALERSAPDPRGLRLALAGSMMLHLAVLIALAYTEGPAPLSGTRPEALHFELIAAMPAPQVKVAETTPAAEAPPESPPVDDAPPAVADAPGPSSIEPPSAAPELPTPAADPAPPPGAERSLADPGLRGRLLRQLEADGAALALRPSASAAERLQGRPAPRLPSARGWLSEHVGTVAAQVDAWQEPDGTERAQVTRPDGTVVCMQRRAPSFEEIMQPWKSTVVTMSRLCGRARPARVDYDDLRVRPPPGGGR